MRWRAACAVGAGERHPGDPDLPIGGGMRPPQHPEGGGLAGAVGPQQAENLTGLDLELDGIDGQAVAKPAHEAARREHPGIVPQGRPGNFRGAA
jgi:hypothetical protein